MNPNTDIYEAQIETTGSTHSVVILSEDEEARLAWTTVKEEAEDLIELLIETAEEIGLSAEEAVFLAETEGFNITLEFAS